MNEGKKLQLKRKAVGLTAEELAKRVGVTKQTISNVENDRLKHPSIPLIRVINWELDAAKGDMTWEELLEKNKRELLKQIEGL